MKDATTYDVGTHTSRNEDDGDRTGQELDYNTLLDLYYSGWLWNANNGKNFDYCYKFCRLGMGNRWRPVSARERNKRSSKNKATRSRAFQFGKLSCPSVNYWNRHPELVDISLRIHQPLSPPHTGEGGARGWSWTCWWIRLVCIHSGSNEASLHGVGEWQYLHTRYHILHSLPDSMWLIRSLWHWTRFH